MCLLSEDLATAVVLEVLVAAKIDVGSDAGVEHDREIDGLWVLDDRLWATLRLRCVLKLADFLKELFFQACYRFLLVHDGIQFGELIGELVTVGVETFLDQVSEAVGLRGCRGRVVG